MLADRQNFRSLQFLNLQFITHSVVLKSIIIIIMTITIIIIIVIHVVWQLQSMALFDIHVVDTDTRSHPPHSHAAVLASASAEKKRKYSNACPDHCATFTPLYFSVDELAGDEANCFLCHLS